MIDLKQKLLEKCHQYAHQRISNAELAQNQAQEAANEEQKSSAGDKYNTQRAMMQLERDKYARQLAEAKKLLKALNMLKAEHKNDKVQLGSLVETNGGTYFIAISIGKTEVEGKPIMVISPISPIGQLMLGKKEGDTISFGSQVLTISRIS